jgi:putrescine transport system permease protein
MGDVPTRSPSPPVLRTSTSPTLRAGEVSFMRALVLAVPWIWLVAFLLLPTAIVLKIALSQPADGVPPFAPLMHWIGGIPHLRVTADNFKLILTDPLYRGAFLHSLRVAGLSTLICLLIGYPMALAIARAPEHWRNPLLLALMLPFWTGFLMRINAWIGLLQDNGWINTALTFCHLAPMRLLYTDTAMYIGIVYTYVPFMVLPLYARLTRLDPALLEAAGDLGAPPWRGFLSVTLPLSLPGVWAGSLLVFIPAVGEYVIPELLGGPQAQLIGRVLWNEFFENRDWPTASALACMLLVLLLIVPLATWALLSVSFRAMKQRSNPPQVVASSLRSPQ